MKLKIFMILVVAVLLTGCGARGDEGTGATSSVAEDTGTAADSDAGADETTDEEPYILSFEATTTEGEALTSDCFAQSKLTMINVWATYCNPCLAEMPDLGEIAASYDTADFQMIGVISDVTEESDAADVEYAKELIAETNANYPHLLLNESLYMNLVGAVEAVPTTFFFNQEGEPLGYIVGSQSKEVWEEVINDLLEEEK